MRAAWRLSCRAAVLPSTPSRVMSQAVETLEWSQEAFSRTLQLKALRVPAQQSQEFRSLARPYLLSMTRVKPIQNDTVNDTKLILLNPDVSDTVPDEISRLVERGDVELVDYELSLGYEQLTAAEAIRKLLPADVVVPTAFESVGHVAHLNLRPEHEPYKRAIGQILLDKNPSIATVINKVGMVENEFRLMEYEILAGEPSLETEVRQSGCRFSLDFGKVYWNSRLEYEHTRLNNLFRPGEGVLDLMAGIGPFAIPAAKKGCQVMANDKNPESYRYLCRNLTLNKVLGSVLPFNVDARFCLRVALGHEGALEQYLPEKYLSEVKDLKVREKKKKSKKRDLSELEVEVTLPSLPLRFYHVVMNYPQYAIDFLDMFHGVFDPEHWTEEQMPWVHCYTFMQYEEDPDAIQKKCEEKLGAEIEDPQFHVVRNVAPSKCMCCISFKLPYSIAISQPSLPLQMQPLMSEKSEVSTGGKKSRLDVTTEDSDG